MSPRPRRRRATYVPATTTVARPGLEQALRTGAIAARAVLAVALVVALIVVLAGVLA